jgi:hypothetical protein
MPALMAPLLGLTLGFLLAWSAADELAQAPGSGVTSRALLVVSLFGLMVFAPVSGYFLAFAPDWSFLYLLDTNATPTALQFFVVLLNAVSVPAGFALAARPARLRSYGTLTRLIAAGTAVCCVILGIAHSRLRVNGSYAQFHGDFGLEPVAGGSLGYALLWMGLVLVGAFAWTIRSLRQLGKNHRAQPVTSAPLTERPPRRPPSSKL